MTHAMKRGGACGLPDGHAGQHYSAESVGRHRVANRERMRMRVHDNRELMHAHELMRARYRNGESARSYARQLMQGKRIYCAANHHAGMAKLKEWLGDSRPPGKELSLVRIRPESAYFGYHFRNGDRRPYLLSMDALDYKWETRRQNSARKSTQRDLVKQLGISEGAA